MCDTASGRELLSGVASAKGVRIDMVTGMEARMMGEASMAACGMEVSEVNEIVERILTWYEKSYSQPPKSKTFQEAYDVDNIEPNEEYISVYDSALNILSNCGIDF
jgi:methylamine--corrinoid protein Co-methyltransferase